MAYPATVDSIPDPTPTSRRTAPSLAAGQTAQNAAIEATQTFVGVVSAPADANTLVGRIKTLETAGRALAPSDMPVPFASWSWDPLLDQGSNLTWGTSGTLRLFGLFLPKASTLSNFHLGLSSTGTVTGAYAGLWDHANGGALRAESTNQSALFSTPGLITIPFVTPYAAPAGWIYAGVWLVHSVAPGFHGYNGSGATESNLGTLPNRYRQAAANAGLTTTFPSTLGVQSASAATYWAAVS